MSKSFQSVMTDISATMKDVYGAEAVAVVPGGGTYGMEAVARQFAQEATCLIVRNGFFSYRWTQILEMARLTSDVAVMKACQTHSGPRAPFAPPPIGEVVTGIRARRPAVVFAPHVETASGILLPDDYVAALGSATRAAGGLFVLDCIASGALWVDMRALDVDVLISAPQKGWSASPCAALVMLGARASDRLAHTSSNSFACDLGRWRAIMQAYEAGGHAYHATLPTDALRRFAGAMHETRAFGFERAREAQLELGTAVRRLLVERGFPSVAAAGFEAPGVVVSYTDDPAIRNGSRFLAEGLQVAAGVPLECDEPAGFSTFRIGLFGLDKLGDIPRTVRNLATALDRVG